jgi:hypothetical protein
MPSVRASDECSPPRPKEAGSGRRNPTAPVGWIFMRGNGLSRLVLRGAAMALWRWDAGPGSLAGEASLCLE